MPWFIWSHWIVRPIDQPPFLIAFSGSGGGIMIVIYLTGIVCVKVAEIHMLKIAKPSAQEQLICFYVYGFSHLWYSL